MTTTPTPEAAEAAAPPATTLQKALAEGLGTFVILLVGLGVATYLGDGDLSLAAFPAAFAFAGAYLACGYAFGWVSGAHFNPVVSIGAALGGRLSWKDAGLYAGAQVVGGLVAGLVVVLTALSADRGYEIGSPIAPTAFDQLSSSLPLLGALVLELFGAFVLVLVLLGLTDKRATPSFAPVATAATYLGLILVLGTATGSTVNPARALSTAFFSGGDVIVQQWLFVVIPLIGGAAAGLLYPVVFGHGADPVPGSGLNFSSGSSGAQGYGQPGYYGQPGQPGQVGQPGGQPQWGQQAPAYGGGSPYAPQAGSPYAPQGQAQPGAQSGAQPVAQAAPAEQPIIQDGWQWDPQAQQWIPAQQQPPAQGGGAPGQAGGGWPAAGGGEQTQVRPTDGR